MHYWLGNCNLGWIPILLWRLMGDVEGIYTRGKELDDNDVMMTMIVPGQMRMHTCIIYSFQRPGSRLFLTRLNAVLKCDR